MKKVSGYREHHYRVIASALSGYRERCPNPITSKNDAKTYRYAAKNDTRKRRKSFKRIGCLKTSYPAREILRSRMCNRLGGGYTEGALSDHT